jgi:hypothetical protein
MGLIKNLKENPALNNTAIEYSERIKTVMFYLTNV